MSTYGLDVLDSGTRLWDFVIAAPILVLPAFGVGVAVLCTERCSQLASLTLGAACGLLLLPRLTGFEATHGPGGELLLSSASGGLVRLGALLAASGRSSRSWCGARPAPGSAPPRLSRPCSASPRCSCRSPGASGSSRGACAPVQPTLELELPEGLLTIEPSELGIDHVRLDLRALTPPASKAPFDRRFIERACGYLDPEKLAAGRARVLLIGQLTPGRALLLRGLGVAEIDRSAAWHEAMPLVEKRLFDGLELPPGEVLAPAEALRRAEAGTYDLVLVPPIPGVAPRLPAWEPAGTIVVIGLDATGSCAPLELDSDVGVATDLVDLAVLVMRGEGSDATAGLVPSGAPAPAATPWATLGERRVARARTNLRELTARFAATGDPNADGATEWPSYDADSDQHLVLDDPVSVGSHAADKCSFWADKDYLAPEIGTD